MISKRAERLFGEDPPLVKAHFKCATDPFSEDNLEGYINLGTAENHLMDAELKQKLDEIVIKDNPFHYNYPQGSLELRNAYAKFSEYFLNIKNMKIDNICVSSGLSSVLEILSYVLCDEGDEVLCFSPLYNGFIHDIAGRFNANLVSSACINEKGIDLIQLESDIKSHNNLKVLLLNNPHNPTGHNFSLEDLKEIVKLAKKYNLEIISDEVYANSVYNNKSFYSLLSPDFEHLNYSEHIHHLYGMAKDFCMSGFKLGYFYSENDRVSKAVAKLCYFHTVSTYTQAQVTEIINDIKWCEGFFESNHKKLKFISDKILKTFESYNIPYFKNDSGLFLWVNLKEIFNIRSLSDEMEIYNRFLNEAKFNIVAGNIFHSKELGWYRICFAQSELNIEHFLMRFKKLIE